jgi:hypothetical protein
VPVDRRILASVVTLSDYPTAELAYSTSNQQTSDLPVAFLSANDFEILLGREVREVESLLNLAIDSAKSGNIVDYNDVRRRIRGAKNPIVEAAWDANPVRRFMKNRLPEQP